MQKIVFNFVVYQQVIFLVKSISVLVFHHHRCQITSFLLFQLCVKLSTAFRALTCKRQFPVHESEPFVSVLVLPDHLTLTPNVLNLFI